jgi:hypothetical protein
MAEVIRALSEEAAIAIYERPVAATAAIEDTRRMR